MQSPKEKPPSWIIQLSGLPQPDNLQEHHHWYTVLQCYATGGIHPRLGHLRTYPDHPVVHCETGPKVPG